MADDVILNKAAIIERCVKRVRDLYADDDANLFEDITRQDAIVLNLQRACEAAIDLAMHLVRRQRLGVPQESREAFSLLAEAGALNPLLAATLARMVGFRNLAVHEYQALQMPIVRAIIREQLADLLEFAAAALRSA
jgi:uncharacterized protein YutE (UPF0331/DUF86 family)